MPEVCAFTLFDVHLVTGHYRQTLSIPSPCLDSPRVYSACYRGGIGTGTSPAVASLCRRPFCSRWRARSLTFWRSRKCKLPFPAYPHCLAWHALVALYLLGPEPSLVHHPRTLSCQGQRPACSSYYCYNHSPPDRGVSDNISGLTRPLTMHLRYPLTIYMKPRAWAQPSLEA